MSSAFFTIAAQADSRIKKDKKPVSRDKFGASLAKAFGDRLYIRSGVSSFVYFRIKGGGGRMSAPTASFSSPVNMRKNAKKQNHMLREQNSIKKISYVLLVQKACAETGRCQGQGLAPCPGLRSMFPLPAPATDALKWLKQQT